MAPTPSAPLVHSHHRRSTRLAAYSLQAAHPHDAVHVYVDAHILCTPAPPVDIDGDGHEELVIAVSYFFDKEYYDAPGRAADLAGIERENYVAGNDI